MQAIHRQGKTTLSGSQLHRREEDEIAEEVTYSKFKPKKNNELELPDEVEDEENEETEHVSELKDIKFQYNKPKQNEFYSTKYSPKDYKECFPIEYKVEENIPLYFNNAKSGPSFICLHGAGHSAQSFSLLAKYMKNDYRLFAYDSRGHGNNTLTPSYDLSKDTQIHDFIKVLSFIISLDQFSDDTFIVLGHSMGGSIATFAVDYITNNIPELSKRIQALIVIDVVEGTALEALPFMESVIKSRVATFNSVEESIEYMVKSNTIQSTESARYSVPSLVYKEKNKYQWKIDLIKTKEYWREWFEGLTNSFLSLRLPKLLILAASDRMDKELTIAHMQGKFKMVVVNGVGHIVHEDNVKNTCITLVDFVKIFRIPDVLSKIKPIVGKINSLTNK